MSIVSRQDWISALPDAARQAVEAAMRIEDAPRGARITETGGPAVAIHRLRTGMVKLTGCYADGREALVTIYAPGAVFSETALVADRPYAHTKVAAVASQVEVLDRSAFQRLYAEWPAIPEALCRKFAASIARQFESREQRDTRSLRARVALALCDLGDAFGEPDGDASRVYAPLSQEELGSHLGVTRQSVQKEVTALRRAGLLAKHDGLWILQDPGRLRRFAESAPA